MNKSRLEAFSDGVIAILITVMLLELKVPHGGDWAAIRPILPVFLSYVLSFVFLGIYWNNHHHVLHAARKVTGGVLWANLHLLFWLSLVSWATGWMGENQFAPLPTATYGVILFFSAVAFTILVRVIIHGEGPESPLAAALGSDFKSKLSLVLYAAAIPLAFVKTWIAHGIFVFVALMWLVPDRRIETKLSE